MGGSGSYCRCKGRWRRARLGLRPAGTRSSLRQPQMAPAGSSGRGRRAREELALWRLLYTGSVSPCYAEWRIGRLDMGRTRAVRGQHGRAERPSVRARHAAARTPAALGVCARLGKAHCLCERAASGSAARLGRRPAVRRGAGAPGAWLARRRGEAGARPKIFRLSNFECPFLPKFV
jgi:hypothetical protein